MAKRKTKRKSYDYRARRRDAEAAIAIYAILEDHGYPGNQQRALRMALDMLNVKLDSLRREQ